MTRIVVWITHFPDREALQLQWLDPGSGRKRTRSTRTADPELAEQIRADREYELNHGLHAEPSRLAWPAFRQLFWDERVAHLRLCTQHNYQVCLDLFEEICKPAGLTGISERTISAFAAGLRRRKGNHGQPQQASTVKVRLQFLRTALRWAASQKLLPACPVFPKVKVPKKRPQPVPLEIVERLLVATADQQMRVYLLCAWLAGLRLNEALALSREESDTSPWLDPARRRIWLPAGFVKGDEDQWVPLDPELAAALAGLPVRPDGKVFHFVEERSGKPVSDIAVSARVRELAVLAGVRLTCRSLRRGFGCRYAGKVPAQVLQRLMRHANIKTTMDYYANVDDAVEEAVLGPQHGNSRGNSRLEEAAKA